MDNTITNKIDIDNLQLLTAEQAWHYRVLPALADDGTEILLSDVEDLALKEQEVRMILGLERSIYYVKTIWLNKELGLHYRRERGEDAASAWAGNEADQDLLEQVILSSRRLGSSDIHFEAMDNNCRIRFRVDGQLVERYQISKEDWPALVNKLKIQAGLDISEKRLPQDGRISFEAGGEAFDIRVSSLPTLHGEKIVLRLLGRDAAMLELSDLGFLEADLKRYLKGIYKPQGLVLISGPTGSGKTTSLYASLHLLNDRKRNIVTIEDPIEYTLEGINQVQVRDGIGLNFSKAMRSFLRQDPDIIMVGEIRDEETAEMAIRAALTGHLVFSTIHTNSAVGIITRLLDMDVPSYLLAGTLNLAVAQRLVRLLCPDCKVSQPIGEAELPATVEVPEGMTAHNIAEGCPVCHYTGYRGRKAIYEVLEIDDRMAQAIREVDLQLIYREKQSEPLSANALKMWERGESSFEEIYPIVSSYKNS